MHGDCFELHHHVREPAGLSAAGGGFDEVQQGRPAHEAMERGAGLIENGPQVLERVLVPAIADGRSAAGKVRRREQGSALHGKQRPLWLSRADSMSASFPRKAVTRAPTSCPVSPY